MKAVRAVVSLLLAGLAFWALDNRHGTFPALGRLLDPFSGFWQNGERVDRIPEKLVVPGLRDEVRVVWDDRRVPHIFAANDHDLYLAQGWVAASLRLWQMEFQALYTAGRISEVVGPIGLRQDIFNRRFGLAWAAERALEALLADVRPRETIEAFTAGVNAYIRSLGRKRLPVEYKIFDYRPEPWTELKCALLLKAMSYTLASGNREAAMTAARDALGEETVDRLFPFFPPLVEPVIPPGTVFEFEPLDARPDGGTGEPGNGPRRAGLSHGAPSSAPDPGSGTEPAGALFSIRLPARARGRQQQLGRFREADPQRIPHPLQRHAPRAGPARRLVRGPAHGAGNQRPRGLIPERPASRGRIQRGHCLGVHQRAARTSSTGTPSRSRTTPGPSTCTEANGGRRRCARRRIKVRGGRTVVDRVVHTHHGPVVRWADEPPFPGMDVPAGAALRWAGPRPFERIAAIYALNRARDHDDYVEALKILGLPGPEHRLRRPGGDDRHPAQREIPAPPQGPGRYVLDGSDPNDDWPGWVPHEHVPAVKDPERGFVSSANQLYAGPGYPYYLGWDYMSFERGARINEILASMSDITPDDMIRMQADVLDIRARAVLPRLLALLEGQDDERGGEGVFRRAPGLGSRSPGGVRGPDGVPGILGPAQPPDLG
jgi:penicillin G amidase